MTRSDAETAPPAGQGLRERHKQSTRHALIETTLRLFDERGYAEVTVEDICAEVEISPRTFFRYFPAKEQVLAAPITGLLDVLRDALAARPRDAELWASLRAALASALDIVERDPEPFLRASRVIKQAPSALASSARALMEWELTVRDEITQRLGVDAASQHPRLLLGVWMVALRAGLDRWSETDGAEPARALVERALDELEPGALAIVASARR